MLVKLINGENNKEFMYEYKGTADFDLVRTVLKEHAQEVLGGEYNSCDRITIFYNNGYQSTYRNNRGCNRNHKTQNKNSCLTSRFISERIAKEDYREMSTVTIKFANGELKEVPYGIDMYETGFVINAGKTSTNLFGVSKEMYLEKFTSRHIKCITKEKAKHFKTVNEMINYINKNERVFKYAVSNYGYSWSCEYSSEMFKNTYLESMSQKKKLNFENKMEELQQLLAVINREDEVEQEFTYGSDSNEEAIIRLKELNVPILLSNFMKGKIMLSDVGGIIYDLDDFAKQIVEEIKSDGGLPYVVLRNGNMYSVLYVSNYRDEWEYERYNKKNGMISASCTLKEFGVHGLETGDIVVERTMAGGLMRTA